MQQRHDDYSSVSLSAARHRRHMTGASNLGKIMTYNPARSIVADDPLAYFSGLIAPKPCPLPVQQQPAAQVIDLMYAYYTAG